MTTTRSRRTPSRRRAQTSARGEDAEGGRKLGRSALAEETLNGRKRGRERGGSNERVVLVSLGTCRSKREPFVSECRKSLIVTDLPVGFTYLFSRKVRIHSTRLLVSHQTGGCERTSCGSALAADRPVLPVIAFPKASWGPWLRAPRALGRRPGVRDAGEPRVRSRPGRVRSRSARSAVSAQPSLCTAIPGSHPRVPGGDHLDRPTGRHGPAASQEPLCPPVPIGRARVRRGRTRVDSPGPPSASHPVPSRPAASPIGVARPGGEPPHRRQRGVALS